MKKFRVQVAFRRADSLILGGKEDRDEAMQMVEDAVKYGVWRGLANDEGWDYLPGTTIQSASIRYVEEEMIAESNVVIAYPMDEPAAEPVEQPEEVSTDRSAEILAAIQGLPPESIAPELYTTTGTPKLEPINAKLGFEITAAERDEAIASKS